MSSRANLELVTAGIKSDTAFIVAHVCLPAKKLSELSCVECGHNKTTTTLAFDSGRANSSPKLRSYVER